jgi:hypothetical protein
MTAYDVRGKGVFCRRNCKFWLFDSEDILLAIYVQSEYGREVPLFEVEATTIEPTFQRLYTYLFGMEEGSYSAAEIKGPVPNAIFILNFDKVSFFCYFIDSVSEFRSSVAQLASLDLSYRAE